MPEKSISSVVKFTETKDVSTNLPKNADSKGSGEQCEQFHSNGSSGSNSVCSSTSESSIQTQVSILRVQEITVAL